ncbi:hypothetical protein AbraIFM66951_006907 [Aspergillus brasiliensis]|uniref:Peptidase A1 domain-containing protein n=1 Tax=Aspergillus brasiliensis TaxID=319629 RepID=A0A9W5YJZ7_9EURO|nr:hypothetical protein AbraCBS73388_010828 [Aspergillus brasiliensis]GKZ44651.1 hypothetical protein AbraIFM66951_006907 [Aspergillus brasiliensis]
MRFTDCLVSVACLASTASAFGHHAHRHGLLQLPRAFSREGIWLYPALHPDHDPDDLQHLDPQLSKALHYSQEGHRPALHGAKHAQLQSTFSSPTVVLEHSSHIKDVVCDGQKNTMQVCFKTPEALQRVQKSWKDEIQSDTFNLVTYHIGCGDQTGDHRSFFRASNPTVDNDECVSVSVEPLDERQAIHAGDLSWGTFLHPGHQKREPIQGHVKTTEPEQPTEGTVDITKDPNAVQAFFSVPINTDIPDRETEPLDFMDNDYSQELAKRGGLFSWIVEGIRSIVNLIQVATKISAYIVVTKVKVVVEHALVMASLIMVPFGRPFDRAYHADIPFDLHTGTNIGIGSDAASVLGGTQNGFVLAEQGTAFNLQCVDCGARGNFSFDGRLAFNIADGLTAAEIALTNHEPLAIDAVFRLNLNGRILKNKDSSKFKTSFTKELFNIGLPGLWIPKVVAIGPMVTLNTGVSLYVDGHMEIVTGAKFKLDAGHVELNASKGGENTASGFNPSAKWVLAASPGEKEADGGVKGNAVATFDSNMPLGLEFGIDVLSGFKETVGVFFDPSVYFTAGISINEGHKCDKGIEMRAGAKGRSYSSALGIWEYQFGEWKLLEKGLGCLRWNQGFQFNADDVEPEIRLNEEVSQTLGGDLPSDKNATLNQPDVVLRKSANASRHEYHDDLKKEGQGKARLPPTHGFRMIQDAKTTSTLVSGTDGKIYLVNNSAEYDISAPWGALDISKNIFSYDVFGRLIHCNVTVGRKRGIYPVGVAHGEAMPEDSRQMSFGLANDGKDESYLLNYHLSEDEQHYQIDPTQTVKFYLPLVCQVANGLQLFASKYLVMDMGFALTDQMVYASDSYKDDLEELGLGIDPTKCRTVRLVSNFKKSEDTN